MTGSRTLGCAAAAGGVAAVATAMLVRHGARWGSTPEERSMPLPGDTYLEGGPAARVKMTRAISVAAPTDTVWPWLAQMGRGAGWYSHDRLDNGGRRSARHIVSWIPAPRIGDASAIGWLRDMEPGRSLTWWMPGETALGATVRMVIDIRLAPQGNADGGSRLVIRISGDATGPSGFAVAGAFQAVDSIMAIRQLRGIKERAERFGARTADPDAPETSDRDQFQEYEVVWSSGERAGVPGREHGARWRQAAREAR